VELIVVILIVGILAAIAVVAVDRVTDRAHSAAALSNLRQVATATLVKHTDEQAPRLSRELMLAALVEDSSVDVVDGLNLADTWTLYGKDTSPTLPGDFAVGFDHGPGQPANDEGGSRAAVLTTGGDRLFAWVIVYGGSGGDLVDGAAGEVPAGTTPSDVLGDPSLISDPVPGGSGGPGGPGGPGGSGGPGTAQPGEDFGFLGLTAEVDSWGMSDGAVDTVRVTVWALPAESALDGSGISMTCASPHGPLVDTYEPNPFAYGNMTRTADTLPGETTVGHAYTCTVTAADADGDVYASRTFTTNGGRVIVDAGTQGPGDVAWLPYSSGWGWGSQTLFEVALPKEMAPPSVVTVTLTCGYANDEMTYRSDWVRLAGGPLDGWTFGEFTEGQWWQRTVDHGPFPTCQVHGFDADGDEVREWQVWDPWEEPFRMVIYSLA
jgi:type II secretory pathway pseudopilin PulG